MCDLAVILQPFMGTPTCFPQRLNHFPSPPAVFKRTLDVVFAKVSQDGSPGWGKLPSLFQFKAVYRRSLQSH